MQILVVEEETRVRSFLVGALGAEGFSVDPVGDLEDGLRSAIGRAYDLTVLDISSTRRDGLSILRAMHEHHPERPIIVLSGAGDVPAKLRSFTLGASDHLAKPFSVDELLARVRVHLQRSGAVAPLLEGGGLSLDQRTREARIGSTVTSLSDREFHLLQYLLQNAGEVVSRERLLSEVWGYDFDPHSNVVDVCVRRLRQRLGDDAPIDTIRNVGYRIATRHMARPPMPLDSPGTSIGVF